MGLCAGKGESLNPSARFGGIVEIPEANAYAVADHGRVIDDIHRCFRAVIIRLAVRPSAAARPRQQRDDLEAALDLVAS